MTVKDYIAKQKAKPPKKAEAVKLSAVQEYAKRKKPVEVKEVVQEDNTGKKGKGVQWQTDETKVEVTD